MIEAALAIVVLAVGVLAVFVLFSAGLDTKTRASGDTQAALFADGVFDTLRAESAAASEQERWEGFWGAFADGTTNIPVAAAGVWVDSNMVVRAGGLYTNVYSIPVGGTTTIVDHALRYQLLAEPEPPDSSWTNRVNVTLKVWEGMFGATNGDSMAAFYTEIDNPGRLP